MSNRPVPTNIKRLRGTLRKDRMNKNEPKPDNDKIVMPNGLSKEAQNEWKSISKKLTDSRIMSNLDCHALAMYCESYATWIKANKEIQKNGLVTSDTPSGVKGISPYYKIAGKSFDQMRALLIEFGMTPSSRTKVSAIPEEEPNEFDQFM